LDFIPKTKDLTVLTFTWRGKARSRKLGKELNCLLFHKSRTGLPLWLQRSCIERKIRAILEKHRKSRLWASNHSTLVRKNFMLPLVIMPNMGRAFNQYLLHMKEKSFTKTDELPSSLWKQRATLVIQRFTKTYAEFGTVYRYEQSELHGLTRVGFTQDDAHIFCTQNNWMSLKK
jgi:threonyl-tRNA synthetase